MAEYRKVVFEINITDALNFAEIKEPKPMTPKDPKAKKVDPPADWKRAIVINFSRKIALNADGQFGKLEDYPIEKSEAYLIEDWEDFNICCKIEKEMNEVFLNEIATNRKMIEVEIYKAKDASTLSQKIGSLFVNIFPLLNQNDTASTLEDWIPATITDEASIVTNSEEPESFPQLKISINTSDVLITKEERQNGNLFTLKVGPLINLPTTWIPKDNTSIADAPFDYNVSVQIPLNDKISRLYKLGEGRLMYTVAEDDPDKKNLVVLWNGDPLTVFLQKSALGILDHQANEKEPLKLTFDRTIRKEFSDEGWIDENFLKYKASIAVDISKLTFPGICTIDSKSKLVQIKDPELGKIDPKKKPPAPAKGKKPPPPEVALEPDQDKDPYESANTLLEISVNLERPLVPSAKDRPKPNTKPNDLIPKRQKVMKKVDSLDKFKHDIISIVDMMAEEFKNLKQSTGAVSKDKLLVELSNSGKLFAFKEKLKKTVVLIAKEKFANDISASSTTQEMDKFYNDIFVYLISQMHVVINNLYDNTKTMKDVNIGLDGSQVDKLKRLIQEAQVEKDFEQAYKLMQKKLDSNQDDAQIYFEFADICLGFSDYSKAETLLKDCISRDVTHLASLQVYGSLLSNRDQLKEAEVFLQASIDVDNNNLLSWCLLELLYELMDKEKERHQAEMYRQSLIEGSDISHNQVLLDFLFHNNFLKLVERVMLRFTNTNSLPYLLNSAQFYFRRGDYSRVEDLYKQALNIEYKSTVVWKELGNVYIAQERINDAEQAFETVIGLHKEDCTDALLHYQLGKVYLEKQKYENAKSSFMEAVKYWPCGITWLGVGRAYYMLEDLTNSEQAFNESNIFNNLNPDVWGYLTLVCLKQNRLDEADKAVREAMRLKIKNRNLLEQLIQQYHTLDKQKEVVELTSFLKSVEL